MSAAHLARLSDSKWMIPLEGRPSFVTVEIQRALLTLKKNRFTHTAMTVQTKIKYTRGEQQRSDCFFFNCTCTVLCMLYLWFCLSVWNSMWFSFFLHVLA